MSPRTQQLQHSRLTRRLGDVHADLANADGFAVANDRHDVARDADKNNDVRLS